MAGIEAEDSADAALGLRAQQAGACDVQLGGWNFGQKRGKVVVKDVGAGVGGRLYAAGAGVAGAEIAGGVIVERGGSDDLLGLALPGALGAVRRDQHPLAQKRVPAAVRGFEEERVEHKGSCKV